MSEAAMKIAKRSTAPLKNVMVDKDVFTAIMRKLIASPPIRKDDLKPKRGTVKKRAKGGKMTAKDKRIAGAPVATNII